MLVIPWLSLGIDAFSRAWWGYYLGISTPTDDTDALLIRSGVLPKTNNLGHSLKNDWPVYGIPGNFFTDNGSDFRANIVDIGCGSIGTTIKRGPVQVPNFRAIVERSFWTIDTEFLDHLPGRIYPDTAKNRKIDYDPKKSASLEFHQFERELMKWALDEYHVTPQEDLGGMTPLEKWREATGKDSPHAPQLPPDLDLF